MVRTALRVLDRVGLKPESNENIPAHLVTGRRGEEDAYFYLRRLGYVIVARNYRTARHRGEIDLIGWDKDVLCFVEVKTRTTRDVKPAEAAVDRKKRHDLRAVIRDYLRTLPKRQFPEPPAWRFDVMTVYYEKEPRDTESISHSATSKQRTERAGGRWKHLRAGHATFELFQNAALSS